ncbi:hypothetical protein TNCV_4970341 [Trichonephila clavipes]|nr:hypothetical protein TNCV_4970341 [Trichonephila clavipes]
MPTQIKDELDSVYGDSAPSFTTVKLRATEFKRGPSSSTLLTRSSPKRLLFVPSSKNWARRTDIFVKWRGNHLREQLFCRENTKYYLDELQRWEHRWEKCVELQEDYVEK